MHGFQTVRVEQSKKKTAKRAATEHSDIGPQKKRVATEHSLLQRVGRVATEHSQPGSSTELQRVARVATEHSQPESSTGETDCISDREYLWREDVQTLSSEPARHAGDAIAARVFEDHLRLYVLASEYGRHHQSDAAPPGGFTHHLHAVLRTHKSLLCAAPGEESTYQRAAQSIREHMQQLRATARVSPATEQQINNDLERLLHKSMEEHCWTGVADIAKELHEWATNLAESRSADVSYQLAALKRRYKRLDESS